MAISLLASNNAQTVLASGISSTATTLTVNTGTGSLFPSPVPGSSIFKLTLIDAATGTLAEIVHVTSRAGDVMTVERAQEGTSARIWSANDIAANMMTAGTLSYFLDSFQPLNAKLTAFSALTAGVDGLGYFTGNSTMAITALTAAGRSLIGQSSVANMLTYLGALKITNYLSEISAAGTAAQLSARSNLSVYSKAEVDGKVIGIGQSWASFSTTQRQNNVNYTNDTGRPIMVSVTAGTASTSRLVVDGISMSNTIISGSSGGGLFVGSVVVPAGSVYQLTSSAPAASWAELR